MRRIAMVIGFVLTAALFVGCAAPQGGAQGPPPRGQTYSLASVKQRLSQARRGMRTDEIRRVLGRPAIMDGTEDGLMTWFYLPPRNSGFQLPRKLRVIFTGGVYVSHSYANTFVADYTWQP